MPSQLEIFTLPEAPPVRRIEQVRLENTNAMRKRMRERFNELMAEKTPSGLSPNMDTVMDTIASEWCKSKRTVENILRGR